MAIPWQKLLKDPDAALIYAMDWTAWLGAGQTIIDSAWQVTGPDTALTCDEASRTDTVASVRLSGGTLGALYVVTNRITVSGTPTQMDDRSFQIQIAER